jgi:hypothetical protein
VRGDAAAGNAAAAAKFGEKWGPILFFKIYVNECATSHWGGDQKTDPLLIMGLIGLAAGPILAAATLVPKMGSRARAHECGRGN